MKREKILKILEANKEYCYYILKDLVVTVNEKVSFEEALKIIVKNRLEETI